MDKKSDWKINNRRKHNEEKKNKNARNVVRFSQAVVKGG